MRRKTMGRAAGSLLLIGLSLYVLLDESPRELWDTLVVPAPRDEVSATEANPLTIEVPEPEPEPVDEQTEHDPTDDQQPEGETEPPAEAPIEAPAEEAPEPPPEDPEPQVDPEPATPAVAAAPPAPRGRPWDPGEITVEVRGEVSVRELVRQGALILVTARQSDGAVLAYIDASYLRSPGSAYDGPTPISDLAATLAAERLLVGGAYTAFDIGNDTELIRRFRTDLDEVIKLGIAFEGVAGARLSYAVVVPPAVQAQWRARTSSLLANHRSVARPVVTARFDQGRWAVELQ